MVAGDRMPCKGDRVEVRKRVVLILAVIPLAVVQFTPILVVTAWLHMVGTLAAARREGVYATPEDGMHVLVTKTWIGVDRVEIEYAGPNSFDGTHPDVWFVTAKVWAARRGDLTPVGSRGYDSAGSFFLRVHDGWVHVPEGRFPDLVGTLMHLFRYSG
jgi:hypothetical protein